MFTRSFLSEISVFFQVVVVYLDIAFFLFLGRFLAMFAHFADVKANSYNVDVFYIIDNIPFMN